MKTNIQHPSARYSTSFLNWIPRLTFSLSLILTITPIFLFGQNTRETEGHFLRYEIGDYEHAVFKDREGHEISFWLTNESATNGVMDAIDQNTDRWLHLTYQLITQHIPEAGMDVELEVLVQVDPLKDPVNNLLWTKKVLRNNGEQMTFKLFGSSMSGFEDIYNIHTIQINSNSINQKLTGLRTETLINEYYTGFIIEDMNFDGYLDFRIQEMTGSVNTPWLFFIYNQKDKEFEQTFLFNELSNPEFQTGKNLITTTWRGSAATYGEATYKLQKDQLVKLNETEYEYIEEGQYRYISGQLINNNWTSLSGQGWEHAWYIDLTGDNIDETIYLDYRTAGDRYKSQLKISSSDSQELWNHQWTMTKEDLVDDLLREEGNIPVWEWVNEFFSGELLYGGAFDQKKLKIDDLQPDLLQYTSDKIGIPVKELQNQILEQKTNYTLFYRASWRQDVIDLVYLPQLNQFIQYGAGQY